jgi:putative exosortase-associated protein (TIGR04073 family)
MSSRKTVFWSALLGAVVLTVTLAAPAQAEDMGDKACRGLAGVTLGVLELPGNMVDISNKEGVLLGCTEGFLKGLVMIPLREIIGTYEVLTFPFEIEKGYKPVLPPEYPWSYFCGKEQPAKPADTKK